MSAPLSCLEALLSPGAAHSGGHRERPAAGRFSDALAQALSGRTGHAGQTAAAGHEDATHSASALLAAQRRAERLAARADGSEEASLAAAGTISRRGGQVPTASAAATPRAGALGEHALPASSSSWLRCAAERRGNSP